MRVKGALHVHSKLSHDGKLTIGELAELFRARGYNFAALGEHSQDMDSEKIELLKSECAKYSGDGFLLIPGLEYSCRGGVHLFSLGSTLAVDDVDPVTVATRARAGGAFVVLAHPSRLKWNVPPELAKAVNAAEFWNVAYDGKYLPSHRAPQAFVRMRMANPKLLATGGQDLHRPVAFYDVSVSLDVPSLTREAILTEMHSGNYEIRSRFFKSGSRAEFSALKTAGLKLVSWKLSILRRIRNSLKG